MAFPTLAQLDAVVIPAMATPDESAATHRTRDGVETTCTAWLDEVSVESYTESGMTATSQRREITIQRAEVARPLAQETVEIGAEVWRLQTKVSDDSGSTRWIVSPVRGEGA